MISDRKQQLFLTCLKDARQAKQGKADKSSSITLKSLKDARYQMKCLRLNSREKLDYFSKLDLIQELKKRSIASLSPKAISEYLETSPRTVDSVESPMNESKEECPAPMFNDLIKTDLPEIDENFTTEAASEEEKLAKEPEKQEKNQIPVSEEGGKRAESKNDCETRFELRKIKTKDFSKKNLGKIVNKRKEDILEFIEEGKGKKKLTKSQERGLLDRLRGFSTKFGNK